MKLFLQFTRDKRTKYHTRIFASRQHEQIPTFLVPYQPSGAHRPTLLRILKLFPSRRYPYTSRHRWTQRPRRGGVMNHPDLSVAEVLEELQRRPGNVCSAGRKEYFGFASSLPFIAFLLALMPPNLPKVFFLSLGFILRFKKTGGTTLLSFQPRVASLYFA